jgi:hypothetical protein
MSLVEDFFSEGWFKPFCIFNLWGVTALIAMFEILVLNSIKRQVVSLWPKFQMHAECHVLTACQPVPTHIFALMFFCSAYLGYAAFGWMLTGHRAFFWMDPKEVGSREIVAFYCSAFVSLGPAGKLFQVIPLSFHGLLL